VGVSFRVHGRPKGDYFNLWRILKKQRSLSEDRRWKRKEPGEKKRIGGDGTKGKLKKGSILGAITSQIRKGDQGQETEKKRNGAWKKPREGMKRD